jgi:general secretion pathway protein A
MHPLNDRSPGPLRDASASRPGAFPSLTYEPYYGLSEKPFSLSADPRFLFRSFAHASAFDEIHAGIRRREGLIVLTGEIGTGKTTLCRSVLQHLDRRTFAAFVADPFVSREDLLKTLLLDFGVVSMADLTRGRFDGASRSDLSYPLYEFLDSLVPLQAFAVVIIDEAQNLSLPLLEEIRILSELERREKLLQVVLVGQPELRSNLRLPEMRQVDQRVSVRCELTALDAAGAAGYVQHRLDIAGRGESRVEFTASALEAIHEGSTGVPRLINRICDRALQRAFTARALQIDADFVWTAIGDLGLIPVRKPAARETAAAVTAQPWAADAIVRVPAAPPVPVPTPAVSAPAESAAAGLTEFNAEEASPSCGVEPIERPGKRSRWLAGAAATLLAVTAAGAGYLRAQAGDELDLAALIPARPAHALPQPAALPPQVDLSSLPVSRTASSVAPTARAASAAAGVPEKARAGYSILVASFQNRDRAERLVLELTDAGYGAHAVERTGGPSGRLFVVQISGYASALDVQRDLQQIRELPGGYSDARVVEQF